MNGGKCLVEILKNEHVRYVFGLPGTLDTALRDALVREQDIQYVLALHEFISGSMADGFSRASKKPSFTNFHATSGSTFAMGAMYNAYLDGSPVVFSCATVETRLILQEQPYWPQDLTAIFRPFMKWSHLVLASDDLPLAVRRAFKIVRTKPQGPAFLAFPKDVLDGECGSEIQDKKHYDFSSIVGPDPSLIDAVASVLLSSPSPVMFVGDEVGREDAVDEAIGLAELLAIPVVTEAGFAYKSNSFPSENPLHLGLYHAAYTGRGPTYEIVNTCDLLLGVGCKMFVERGEYPRTRRLPRHAKIVHLTSVSSEIAKNYPVDIGVYADVKTSLRLLMDSVKRRLGRGQSASIDERRRKIFRIRQETDRMRKTQAERSRHSVPISCLRLVKDLCECMDQDGAIVNEGQTVASYFAYVSFSKETQIFGQAGGALGWGLPAALGVKLALPNRQVVALVGDGCFCFSLQALWTAKHYSIPVVTVVCNNLSYIGLKATTHEFQGASAQNRVYPGCDLYEPYMDYAKVAEAFGIRGEKIERPEDLRPTIRRSLGLGEPVVLDVILDPRDAGYGRGRLP